MSTTATYTCAVVATPDETLAAERERGSKAGASALAAAIVTFVGSLLVILASRDLPITRLLDTLRSNLLGPAAPDPGPLARLVQFFDDNLVLVVVARLLPAVGIALATVALVFLYQSTKARNPQLSKLTLVITIAGGVLTVVATVVGTTSIALDVSAFTGSEQQAREVLRSTFTAGGDQLAQLGIRVFGMGLALTAWQAMRVGLLTRFIGILGIIVGLLYILPLDGTLPFLKIFWIAALGMLFLQRWPRALPPAWVTGEAQPWPTNQELREQRAAAQAERTGGELEEKVRPPRRGRAEPLKTPAPEAPARTRTPHSSSKKKKRKRR